MEENTKITLLDEDGNEETFYVIDEQKINGVSYLLVVEDEDSDEAYILKDTSAPEDADANYVFVDDDDELDYIGNVFDQELDDTDIVK